MTDREGKSRDGQVEAKWRGQTVLFSVRFDETGKIVALGNVSFLESTARRDGILFERLVAAVKQIDRYLAGEGSIAERPVVSISDLDFVLRNSSTCLFADEHEAFATLVNALAVTERRALAHERHVTERRSSGVAGEFFTNPVDVTRRGS